MRLVLALSSLASVALVIAPTLAHAQDTSPPLMPPASTDAPAAAPAPVAAPVEAPPPPVDDKEAKEAKEAKETKEKLEWLKRFKVSGYVQPQLIWNWYNDAASPSAVGGKLPAGVDANSVIAKADGSTTNTDFFKLRRARVKFEYMPTDYARFVMELDPTPTGGPSAGIGTLARQVEAQGIVKWGGGVTTEFAAGIFKVPFGYEVLQSDADRPFIERSWSEQNLTPGEFDTGARAYTSLLEKKLNFQLAVVNGQTQGEKQFAIVPDLNRGKDFVGRLAYDFGPFDLGVSGYVGQGQVVDATALKFKQFDRHAFDIEAAFHMKLIEALGMTKVYGELVRGQNMDRGVKYAFGLPTIPTDITQDVSSIDELGYWVRIEQDMSEWFTLGARYDVYTPDSAQGNNDRQTLALLGVVNFTKGLKLMVEYDHAVDNVHKAGTAAPSKKIDTLSTVLQARF